MELTESQRIDEARRLFAAANDRYELGRPLEAVALFEQSYAVATEIRDDARRERIFLGIYYNLGMAQYDAYIVDRDPSRLYAARSLLRRLDKVPESEDRRAGISKRLVVIAAEIERIESETAAPVERGSPMAVPPSVSTSTQPSGRVEAGVIAAPVMTEDPALSRPTEAAQPGALDREPGPADSATQRRLRIGGLASLGVATLGLGTLVAGTFLGHQATEEFDDAATARAVEDADAKGRMSNAMTVAGAVVAGTFGTAGVTLLIVARTRKGISPEARVHLSPAVSPGWSGLTVAGRF